MASWNSRRIFVSALVVYLLLAGGFWQWGTVVDFIGNNNFSAENHFGLSMQNDTGQTSVNYNVLAPLTLALLYVALILIWRGDDLAGELKTIFTLSLLAGAGYWLFDPGADVATFVVSKVLLSAPVAWILFTLGGITLIFRYEETSIKGPIWAVSILFLIVGGMVHGWFGGFSNHLLLALLSMVLHLLGILSWGFWVIMITAVFLIAGLATLTISLALVVLMIAGALLAIILAIIAAIWLAITVVIFFVGTLGGKTPKEIHHEVEYELYETFR